MTQEERLLIEKLRRIEALFARPGTEGERDAAARARDRILERLGKAAPRTMAPEDPPVEFRFSLNDPWSRRLLYALLQHHGYETFRRRGQRRSTIRAYVPKRFVHEVLWPQFREFERELREYFDGCTQRIIEQALSTPGRGQRSAAERP